ncbi:RNase HII [Anoxybacillus vitaminiphilus]|uniref:Ribonuclease HII n=2 Tax=Paranoxybacillus vitaminiphilus TaxID=581036 RepID=A0A327YS45_9BACL|nr:RNase HII [Anoxybacillus vitaminiphilus]
MLLGQPLYFFAMVDDINNIREESESLKMGKQTVKEIEQILAAITDEQDPRFQHICADERKSVQKLVVRWHKQKELEAAQKARFEQMSRYERELYEQNVQYIAGVDEVGRGPIAGPVVAAAVILPKHVYLPGLNDSKKLSESKREELYTQIMNCAVSIGIGVVSAAEIDQLNIYQATKKAMVQAVQQLTPQPDYLLIDAMELPVSFPQLSIVKGDANSISIAASSIIAKVTRDRFMKELGNQYPEYGFEKHMGYGTKEHLEAIQKYGIISEHRKSFAPVREAMQIQKE